MVFVVSLRFNTKIMVALQPKGLSLLLPKVYTYKGKD